MIWYIAMVYALICLFYCISQCFVKRQFVQRFIVICSLTMRINMESFGLK